MARPKKVATPVVVKEPKPVKVWTADLIMAWQKKVFPKATVLGQIKKFREEFKEFIVAKDAGKKRAAMDELADMYIVACSLLRLSTSSGLKAMNDFTWLICEHGVKFESLQAPINRKMDANVARKWVYKNGNYHHV